MITISDPHKKQAEKQEEYEYCTGNIHAHGMQTSSSKNTYSLVGF